MSLKIYRSDDIALKTMERNIIRFNDLFFDANTLLSNEVEITNILKSIDKAEYVSPYTFKGRTSKLGELNKNCLSTGAKTAINVFSYINKIFSTSECGANALNIILKLKQGNIILCKPVLSFSGDEHCDIIFNDEHYTSLIKFTNDMYEVGLW